MKPFLAFLITFIVFLSVAYIGYDLLDELSTEDRPELQLTLEPNFEAESEFLAPDEEEEENTDENESNEVFRSSEGDLHEWIGQEEEKLVDDLGDPDRVDVTPYGYDWHVYQFEDRYKQFGISEEGVVTAFTNSEAVQLKDMGINEEYETVSDIYSFDSEQTVTQGLSSYTFTLTETELRSRPLVQIEDGVWAQLYFDTFTNQLSSVRYLNDEVLLTHRPYSLQYTGELPEKEQLTGEEKEEWDESQARQIFDLSNKIRERHELDLLSWHSEAAETAYYHSKDMFDNEYFSHTSPNHGELKDRLESDDVSYRMAAENIAARYVDGIAAVEGWLNSEGHRVNLLSEDLTHLGAGVYEDYYTQNFITPR
ncbi:CAP domain-containing protein [Salipaludibacillus keqinensis]|nr:CAP domain-containing protein [Salipaludibacillus keqinensis]